MQAFAAPAVGDDPGPRDALSFVIPNRAAERNLLSLTRSALVIRACMLMCNLWHWVSFNFTGGRDTTGDRKKWRDGIPGPKMEV